MTPDVILGLIALALTAFALRGGGMMLGGLIPSTGKAGQFLREMPGAVMISLVAPSVANGGPAEWLATALTAALAWRTRNVLLSMAFGLVIAAVLRQFL